MAKFRVNVFVQHRENEPWGCKVTVRVDGRSKDSQDTTLAAMDAAVRLCMEHHPDLVAEQGMPWKPVIEQITELKPLKEATK